VELIKPNTNIDFLGNRYYAYAFTSVMLVLALLSNPSKGHVRLGIDFSGGVVAQIRFNKTVDTDHVREALAPLGENVVVQKFSAATEEFVLRINDPEIRDRAMRFVSEFQGIYYRDRKIKKKEMTLRV